MNSKYDSELSPVVVDTMKDEEDVISQILKLMRQKGLQENQVRTVLHATMAEHNERTREDRLARLIDTEEKRISTWLKFELQGRFKDRLPSVFHSYRHYIQDFYELPTHGVGKAEQDVIYVLNQGVVTWEVLLEIAASSISEHRRKVMRSLVQEVLLFKSAQPVSVTISDEFWERVSSRKPHRFDEDKLSKRVYLPRIVPWDDVYVLCGVHGGSHTHQVEIRQTEFFLKDSGYMGLTLHEALSMIAAHPTFLTKTSEKGVEKREQRAIVLLGEIYPSDVMRPEKFAALYYDSEAGDLQLFLVTKDEADRFRRAGSSRFSDGDLPSVTYGKAWAKHVIAHSLMNHE